MKINILCVQEKTNYSKIPGLDLWDKERDVQNFKGNGFCIAHPPCQQWGKLKHFANDNPMEKTLAYVCLYHVLKNGGIIEQPLGSSFFREAGLPQKNIYRISQSWFGFPAEKETLLFFWKCRPVEFPLFVPKPKLKRSVQNLNSRSRSTTTLELAQWLVDCVYNRWEDK